MPSRGEAHISGLGARDSGLGRRGVGQRTAIAVAVLMSVCVPAAAYAAQDAAIDRAATAAGPAPEFDRAAIAKALEAVRADPQLSAEKTMKTLRWRDRRQPARAERIGWLAWIAGLFAWLGQSGRYLVWVSAAILAVLAARYVLETATRARLAREEDEPLTTPTHVRDLDIRPASLPPDIGAAARALWDGGQQRAALALLYRGLLSRLAHVHSVPIRDSTTEGDCLALAAAHLATPRHDYVSRLVLLWQHAVYGHEDVSAVAVHDLCDGFATALDRPASSASFGKASA